eukprot:3118082-Heterocapsa_arctica.AAC.1
MMYIPSYYRGVSNAPKKFPFTLPDNPYVRKVIWKLQKGLATMGCLGTGDSEKGEKFGSLRIITSYRKDVDELIREHVPRGEKLDRTKTKLHEFITTNGHQSLDSLHKQFGASMENLIGKFSEYSTSVAATGHTSSLVIASLENDTSFVRDPRAFLVSISRNKQFMILTGDVKDLIDHGSPQVKAVIKTLDDLGLIIPTF